MGKQETRCQTLPNFLVLSTTFTLSWIVLLLAKSQKGRENAVKCRFRTVHEGTRVFDGVTVRSFLAMLSSDPHRPGFFFQI